MGERITVRVSDKLRRQLEDIAEQQERTLSQQLRKITLDFLAAQRRQQAERRRYRAPLRAPRQASPSREELEA